MTYFERYFCTVDELGRAVDESDLRRAMELIKPLKTNGKKIILFGNGGSYAIASHLAVDFTKAAGFRAQVFSDPGLVSCFANDYQFENWVSEAVRAYADSGDVVIAISSSGQSKNIINGVNAARESDCSIITLSGFSETNPLRKLGDINLWVDSKKYNFVEIVHQTWLLAICDALIENES